MQNLFSNINLSEEQRIAYLKVLAYTLCSDKNDIGDVHQYIHNLSNIFNINEDTKKSINIPRTENELIDTLLSINNRIVAIDLIHCLWFAAYINNVATDKEIAIIRKIASLINLDNDTILKIHNFVSDEISFFQQARDVLEIDSFKL